MKYIKFFFLLFFIIPCTGLPMQGFKCPLEKTDIILQFDNEGQQSAWSAWNLYQNNTSLKVFALGFDRVEQHKSIAGALHTLYVRLGYNVFDVSDLEDAILGNFEYSYLPKPEDVRFCESTLLVNEKYLQNITLAQRLINNYEIESLGRVIALGVNSKILPRLQSSDLKEYRASLIELSKNLLAPITDDSQSRHIYLTNYALHVLDLAKKYGCTGAQDRVYIEDEKSTIVPPQSVAHHFDKTKTDLEDSENQNIMDSLKEEAFKKPGIIYNLTYILGGPSLGLNCGLVAQYFLRDYLDQNPRIILPILGISTMLGGLGGYLRPWNWLKKK